MHTNAFDAYEAASWEDRAAAYADFLVPIAGRIADTLLDSAEVRLNSRVIDVATGPGQIAAASAARGARVLGVDIAHEMVALARRRYPELEFMRIDAHRLPLPDASMDAVVGNFAILHLGQPEQAVAEFARILAPGGRLALSTWDAPERARFIGVFVDAVAATGAQAPASIPEGPAFFQFADRERFADLLSSAGLVDVSVRTVSFVHRFSGADDLWDGILGATVRMRDLILGQPADIQSKIRATYDELVAGYVGADGSLDMPVSVKIASGRKGLLR